MRTTLTLDDDVAAILERERARRGLSMKEMVNLALRKGLSEEQLVKPQTAVRTVPHRFGFKKGIDLDRMNQLADELEAEAFRDGLEA